MATRDDVTVDFSLSPRIAEVAAPSTEITVQDTVDTLRKWEDAFQGMPHEKLLDAAGKEPLGGGVLVGITATLRNAKIIFEARRTPAVAGSVTTASTGAVPGLLTFEDSGADFIAAGVQPGSLVINFTDRSIADVVFVNSATQLTTKTLVNGTDNNFDLGDDYQVFNIIQCNIEGGNLVATDENGDPFSPVQPSAFTQVVRTASSSATTQELEDIQYAAYDNAINIDLTGLGQSGTAYPVGTRRVPVDNVDDAVNIAFQREIKAFRIHGDATLGNQTDWMGWAFHGHNPLDSSINFLPAALTDDISIFDMRVDGVIDGFEILLERCLLSHGLTVDGGLFRHCGLKGAIILTGGNTTAARFHLCYGAADPGGIQPSLDCGGDGPVITIAHYSGIINLLNKTGANAVGVGLTGGALVLDATVTAGTVITAGAGKLTDNSTGTTQVIDYTSNNPELIAQLRQEQFDGVAFEDIQAIMLAMAKGRIVENPAGSKIFDVYDQQGIVLYRFQKTVTERQPL